MQRDIHEQLPELSTPSLAHPWEQPKPPSAASVGVPVQGTLELRVHGKVGCLGSLFGAGSHLVDATSEGEEDFVTITGSLSTNVFPGSCSLG